MSEETFEENRLYPGCISRFIEDDESTENFKVHSGWSTPPSVSYLQKYAPLYLQFYEDFSKQWHYKMEDSECRDPISDEIFSDSTLLFPTDTYYPPGLVCAKEHQRQFCPTSGESGKHQESILI